MIDLKKIAAECLKHPEVIHICIRELKNYDFESGEFKPDEDIEIIIRSNIECYDCDLADRFIKRIKNRQESHSNEEDDENRLWVLEHIEEIIQENMFRISSNGSFDLETGYWSHDSFTRPFVDLGSTTITLMNAIQDENYEWIVALLISFNKSFPVGDSVLLMRLAKWAGFQRKYGYFREECDSESEWGD